MSRGGCSHFLDYDEDGTAHGGNAGYGDVVDAEVGDGGGDQQVKRGTDVYFHDGYMSAL